MKIFYSEPISDGEKLIDMGVQNFLITSYNRDTVKVTNNYINKFPEYDFTKCDLLIDSGAFSVWNSKGEDLDPYKYLEKCKRIVEELSPKFNNIVFVSMDKIPGSVGKTPSKKEAIESAQVSFDNYMMLAEELGYKKFIPVVHQHEDLQWLKEYEKYTDYICVSPANDQSTSSKNSWMRDAFNTLEADTKTHGLAVTGFESLYLFPWYSVDSVTWKAPVVYGRNLYWDFFKKRQARRLKDLNRYSELEGFNWKEIMINLPLLNSEQTMQKNFRDQLKYQIKYFQKMEEYMTELWAEKGVVYNG